MRPIFLRQTTRAARIFSVLPLFVLVVLFQVAVRLLQPFRGGKIPRASVFLVLLFPLMAIADESGARLRLAEAALAADDYAVAERELLALTSAKGADRRAVTLLAQAYWRQGKDKPLLNLVDRHYEGRERDVWWCRVQERRGHADRAANCWTMLGEDERAKRALRAKVFTQELAPGQAFGLRRD